MLNTAQEKEILDFIREKRTEIDQIAEFIYWNCEDRCHNFPNYTNNGLCRTLGINPDSKSHAILSELIRLYKENARLKGEEFELKSYPLKTV